MIIYLKVLCIWLDFHFFVEMIKKIHLTGWVLGSLVSPSIFYYYEDYENYYGSYSIYLICCFLALIYLYKWVPEPLNKRHSETSDDANNSNFLKLLKHIFVDSVVQMMKTLFKKRPGLIRCILFLLLIRYVGIF